MALQSLRERGSPQSIGKSFRFLSTYGNEPLRIPPDRELSGQGFADREETQYKFDSDPGVPDLAALDPDGNGWVCEEELGDSPGGTITDVGSPGGSKVGGTPNASRPPPGLLPLLGPRPFPVQPYAHASSQSSLTPPPNRDVGELMTASGLEDRPLPKLLDGGCPEELP